jgi:cytoskeleton protein RodZ
MSELGLSDELVEKTEDRTNAGLTAGGMLRTAREAAGLHVAALAVSMKIPVKKLEALENDRLDLLHDAVFVRALAASVCRTLKIESAPVLAKLPSNTVPKLTSDDRGINARFHTSGESAGLSVRAILTKPPALIVITLLIGVAAVFFFPEKIATESSSVQVPQAPKVADNSESLSSEKLVVASVDVSSSSPASAPTGTAVTGGTTVNPPVEPSQNPSSAPQSEISRLPTDSSTPLSGTVVFRAKAASWVKVVDSKGVVQLSKTLAEGESVNTSGSVPLSIVIGRADAVDVEVRGKAISLSAVAKDNVARFEVK